MKYGICTTPDNFAVAANYGYDYVEMPLLLLYKMAENDFNEIYENCKNIGIKVETVYCMFGDIKLLGKNAIEEVLLREYLSKCFKRAECLGTEIAVLGSGNARRRPDDMDENTAFKQLCAAVRIICEEAEKCGIKVALEELNHKETNTINTLSDVSDLIKAVGIANIGCVADTFHILVEDGCFDGIPKYADMIDHAHIACTTERCCPNEEHADELMQIATAFRNADYNGRLSVECAFSDFKTQAAAAITALKKYIG